MTVGMVLWVLAVGAGVCGAAWAFARLMRHAGRPERWVWAGALGLVTATSWVPLVPEPAAVVSEFRAVEASAVRALFETLIHLPLPGFGLAWVGLATFVTATVVLSELRQRRRRAAMPTAHLWGYPVRVDERDGPSVAGLLHPVLVLPPRAFALEGARRRALVTHEIEHLRAGDVRLIALAWLGVALAPWNPWAWIAARRLAFAVEADCDLRTLRRRRATSPRLYADLLLDVAGWHTGGRSPALRLAMGRDARRLVARLDRLSGRPGGGVADRPGGGVVPALILLSALLVAAPALADPPRVPAGGAGAAGGASAAGAAGMAGTIRAVEGGGTYRAWAIREAPAASVGIVERADADAGATATARFTPDSIDDGRSR